MSISPVQGDRNLYLIPQGKADYSRAASLNLIFDSFSIDFFPFEKVKDGDRILFAGCGNGQLVVEIVKKLNNLNVTVVAFDISQSQLDCAREYAAKENVNNIEWKLHDIHNLDEFKGQFNFVHARFILNHLVEAKLVTKKLCEAVIEDGIFIAEELGGIDLEAAADSEEYIEAVRAWEQFILLQHAKQHSNIAFAALIPGILKKNGMLKLRELKPHPAAVTPEQKNALQASLGCAGGFLTPRLLEIVPRVQQALVNLRDSADCSLIFKHFTQIEAKKSVLVEESL